MPGCAADRVTASCTSRRATPRHATPRQVGFCQADIASESMAARHEITPSDRVARLPGSALQRAASIPAAAAAAALRPL